MASYEYDSQNQELHRIAGGTLYADCPIGSYIPFGGTVIPTGWLLCDGRAVSRTDFADLFAVIGTAYGSGDGSTTFNIPDMREAVPKGAGLTSKSNNHMDADGLAVGEFLDDRIQNITGSFVVDVEGLGCAMPKSEAGAFEGSNESTIRAISGSDTSLKGWQRMNLDASRVARTGATTEVKSVGSNYIIKAKQIGVPADFAPVDEVTSGNMHSVTSNAVANFIINLAGSFSVSLSSNGYTNVDVQLGQTLPNTDYILQFSATSTGSILFTEMSRTTSVVRVNVRNLNDATLTVNCNWFLICKK